MQDTVFNRFAKQVYVPIDINLRMSFREVFGMGASLPNVRSHITLSSQFVVSGACDSLVVVTKPHITPAKAFIVNLYRVMTHFISDCEAYVCSP